MKVCFTSAKKEAIASEVEKVAERDTAWNWLLVGNSSYLNGDVGITCGDSEFWQANPRFNYLVYLLVFLLSELLE
jgi:hypothetical protein